MKENKEIEKPLILVRKEFADNLMQFINDSGLPAFIIEPILKDLLHEVQFAANQEYEANLKYYKEKCENNEG